MPRSRYDDDDDEDEDDDRPRKKTRSRQDEDEDEDDEDEAPRKKRRPRDEDDDRPSRRKSRARDDDDDDEDEDEDDRPVRKKKRKGLKKVKKKGSSLLLYLGLGGGAVLLLGVVAFLLVFFLGPPIPLFDTPKGGFEDMQNALIAKNYGRFYDRLDKQTQSTLDNVTSMEANLPGKSKYKDMNGRDRFIALAQEADKDRDKKGGNGSFERWEKRAMVESVDEKGDTATLTIKWSSGKTEKVTMKKQDGTWRLSGMGGN